MSFSKNAAFVSRSLLTASPSHSATEKSPSAKPAAAQAPDAPLPAPLTTPATMSWLLRGGGGEILGARARTAAARKAPHMKRKGGFASNFSVSLGFASSGCKMVAVRAASPVAPRAAAVLKAAGAAAAA